MTIGKLIEKLKILDPNRIVVLSRDAEGTGYEVLHSIEECAWDPAHKEIGIEPGRLTKSLRDLSYSEEDVLYNCPSAIALYP